MGLRRKGAVINKFEAEGGAAPRDFAALKTLVMARSQSLPRRLAQIAAFARKKFGTLFGYVSAPLS